MLKWRFAIVNLVLLVAVAGSYWGRHIDAATPPQPDFLRSFSAPFQGWATSDEKVDSFDLSLLQPDSVMVRDYKSPKGEDAQLAVIAGHRKQSIHTPAFCMTGDGWETVSQQGSAILLPGRTIQANRLVMTLNNQSVVMTYFFTDGDYCSPSLTSFQAMQMMKRFRSQVPMGALVRIIVPITSTEERADRLSNQFAQATLPSVLESVRKARLVVH